MLDIIYMYTHIYIYIYMPCEAPVGSRLVLDACDLKRELLNSWLMFGLRVYELIISNVVVFVVI